MPPPTILSITPNQGENSAPVQVVIRGANFFGTPAARLGVNIPIAISAATADTLTGTVPSGIPPGVYALTVTNPDAQFDTLSPAYTALNPPSPDTTLETGSVSTFGPSALTGEGDDDHVQVIFFEVPASCGEQLYFRIFDADTGGGGDAETVDEPDSSTTPYDWNTTIAYTLRGGSNAYTHADARSSHPGPAGISSGTLLTQTAIGNDSAYDNNWDLVFGPFWADDGELVGSSRVFKLVVEGVGGDDGNLYNVALSTSSSSNVAPADSRVFAYSWTFPLTAEVSQRPPLYPYVPQGTTSFEQHNWDMDYSGGSGTMTLHTPVQDIVVPVSGISGNSTVFPDHVATSSHPVGDGEDGVTWTVTMEVASPSTWNDLTFWAVGNGTDLAIFTRPTTATPP